MREINVDIVKTLKAVRVSPNNNSNKVNKDRDESFLESFNKFLERNNLKDSKDFKNDKEIRSSKKDSKEKIEDKKETNEEDSFNYLGVLNTNPLITNNYPDETALNTENRLGVLINPELGLESLSEDEIQNLNLFQEDLLAYPKDESRTTNQNFSLEAAKLNLDKALGKEVSAEELAEKTTSIKPEIVSNVGELVKATEGPVKGSNLENLDTKVSELEETLTRGDMATILGKADNLTSEGQALDSDKLLEKPGELGGAEEEIEEVVARKTTETPKNIETNFMLNRIQNSFFNLQEVESSMSPQNLQNIQDTMIQFMKVSKEGDASVMKVRLYPEELGSIDISLKFQNGKLMADIVVQSESIKEMFLNGSSLLNKNLLEQNIPIKNINVTVNENLNSFENSSGQAGQETGREANGGRSLNRGNLGNNNTNQNPIDDIRIDKINKGVKGLDILV